MDRLHSHPHCLVCEEPVEQGLRFAGAVVCPACEREVVEAEAGDPRYDWLVGRFRTFWEGLAEAAASSD